MVKNKASIFSFFWETVENTSQILIATAESWWLGKYAEDIRKWAAPDKQYNLEESQNYNSLTPELIQASINHPAFKHTFNPCSVWWLHGFLGGATDASPDTLEYLAVGSYPKSITIRHEQKGGTHPFIHSAVGCKIVELFGRSARGMHQAIEATFAWHKFENENTATYAVLTTVPDFIGDIDTKYGGQPEVQRDAGGAPATINEIWKVEWRAKRKFDVTKSNDGLTQDVDLYQYESVDLTLYGIFEQGQESDDYISRTVQDISVKTFKADNTYYNKIVFVNCNHVMRQRTGNAFEGQYEEVIVFKAEKITFSFVAEGTGVDNFAKQFPT